MRPSLITCCLLLLCCPVLRAQEPVRARRMYMEALNYQAKKQPEQAEAGMRKLLKEYPAYADAYSTLGAWLFGKHQFRAAADLFLAAEKRCPKGEQLFAWPAARSLLYSGDYNGALARIPSATKDSSWQRLAAQARFMATAAATADTVKVYPVGPPWRVNSRDPELFPQLSADGQKLYFTRRMNGMDEDFFVARPDTCGGWLTARNMGAPPNTPNLEAAQMISADGHYLFFMRCDHRSISGWAQGGCDLLMAYTPDSVWSVPVSFGATINTPAYEGMPCLSPDNRELFFVSDRDGGYGGMDIWSSRFDRGLWQVPRNLGPSVNTPGDETAPFIYADNNTLYFSSDGRAGMGGSDLYVSRREDDTVWSEARNLGLPFNTPYDELSLTLSADGQRAFFASDRDSLAGNFDLYEAALPAALQPTPVTYVKGAVYDSLTKEPLNYTHIFISDSATGRELYNVQSNRGDGSYMIALPIGYTYELYIDRIGYTALTDRLRCYEPYSEKPIVYNIALLPYDYQKPVTDSLVLTLHFPKNSVVISDTDRQEIARVMGPWKGLADVSVLVNGYTDNSGTPLLNEQLSFIRSRLIAAEVKALGFNKDIVQTQGWGEANPITDNDTEEHRDLNRRVEIVIRR